MSFKLLYAMKFAGLLIYSNLNTNTPMRSNRTIGILHIQVYKSAMQLPHCCSMWMRNHLEKTVYTFLEHQTNCTARLCTNWSRVVSRWGKTLLSAVHPLWDTRIWRRQNSLQTAKYRCCATFVEPYCGSYRLSALLRPGRLPTQLKMIVLPSRVRNRQPHWAHRDSPNSSTYRRRLRIACWHWLTGHNQQYRSILDLRDIPARLFGLVWKPTISK